MSGSLHITPVAGVAASGTLTVADYTNLTGQQVTVNELTFTEGADWSAGGSNDAAALSLQQAIQDYQETNGAGATAEGAVITVAANTAGTAGNSIALALSPDTAALTKSGDTLEDGIDAVLSDVVGASGVPVTVSLVSAHSHATGYCTISLYDGTDATGTLVLTLTCPQAKASNFKLGKGISFVSGCFVNITLEDEAKLPSSVTIGYTRI